MNNYTIEQLINIQQLEKLLEAYVRISGIACGLMDNELNIIVGTGLQEICTCYHWDNPKSFSRCWRNDPEIKQALDNFNGDLFECRCKNGMINIAMPIVIEERRLGVFFSGQFFYDDQPPDLSWFQQQAEELGFDVKPYLAVIRQTPLFSHTQVDNTMRFLHQLVQLLAETGHANLQREREVEERRQVEQKLLLLTGAINNASDAFFLIDDRHRFRYVNDVACRTLGYSREELLRMGTLDIDPDISLEILEAFQNKATRKRLPKPFETRHRTKEGRIFPVEISGTPFEYEGVKFGLVMARDITERKQAEQQIKLLSHALDQVHEAAFLITPNARFLYVNQEACRSLEYSRDELLEMAIPNIDPDFSTKRTEEHFTDLLRRGTLTFESHHRTQSGHIFPVEISSSVLEYAGSTYVLSLVRDITERKQMEDMLRQRECEFRTLAEGLPDNIARYNREGITVYVNPILAKSLGATAADKIGMRIREWHTDGSYEAYAQVVDNVLSKGQDCEIEFIVPGTEEEPIVHQIRVIAEHDPDGMVTGALAVGRDISELKRAEQERLAHLHLLACMDQVNRAIQRADDLTQMMSDVLEITITFFDCDRVFLMYPCDPEATTWGIPMERTRDKYPGLGLLGRDIPMTTDHSEALRILLTLDGSVQFGSGSNYPLPQDVSEQFGIKSSMSMVLYPKADKPWQFGVHQCSFPRVWTASEEELLQKIGRRLTDGITSLLFYCNLRKSEARYHLLFENSPVSIWEEDLSGVKSFFDLLKADGIRDIEAYFDQHPLTVKHCAELVKVLDLNEATLRLHNATVKDELLADLTETFTPESFETFRQELINLWQGKTQMTLDTVIKTVAGELRHVTVYASVCPGYETTLAKCLISFIDITERRQAEQKLLEEQQRLNDMAIELTLSEERERRRISVTLHDTLGQDLTLIRMKLGNLNKTELSTDQRKLLCEIKLLTEGTISRVRNLTKLLCPPILESAGFEAALKWLARQIETDYGMQIAFIDDLQDKTVARELQIELYNCVRELLINVAKHAGTTTACLSVRLEADTLAIRVKDNGIGFDADSTFKNSITEGFGLFAISRRIAHIGGIFQITSKQGYGTEVAMNIPLLRDYRSKAATQEQS